MKVCPVVLLGVVMACGPANAVGGDAAGDGRVDSGGSDSGPDSGGGGDSVEPNRSGSRIKMKMLSSGDGAKVFQGNYDSQRGEDCSFQVAADGMTRCLPTPMVTIDSPSLFQDAACSVPVAIWFTCVPAPRYISMAISSSCPPVPGVRVFPALLAAPTNTLFSRSGAQCVQSTLDPATFSAYRISGAEIPPSSFQSATLQIE